MYPLLFDRTYFASLRIDRIDARRGVGNHGVLVVVARIQNTAPSYPNLPGIVHFSGEVSNSNSEHIAEIRACSLRWYGNRTTDETVYLYAPVSFSTLSAVNASRHGGHEDVMVKLDLGVDLDGPHGWEQQRLDVQHRVPASDWARLLASTRHTTFGVIELPLDGEPVPAGLHSCMTRYQAAKNHLQQCQWDDAIIECREVLDALNTAIGATEPAAPLAGYGTTQQRAWSFAERCAAVRVIVRHATHTAHHGQAQFSAEEARFIVDSTGVILKFYCERFMRS